MEKPPKSAETNPTMRHFQNTDYAINFALGEAIENLKDDLSAMLVSKVGQYSSKELMLVEDQIADLVAILTARLR